MLHDKSQGADAKASGSLGMRVNKRLAVSSIYRPSMQVVKIPKCPSCESPNPRMYANCQKCGALAPEITERRDVEPVLTDTFFPWHARALLWLGAFLTNLAKSLEGR